METHDKIYKKVIPEALAALNGRNQLLTLYIDKAEKDFLSIGNTSIGADGENKAVVNERVKKHLIQTLSATVDDMNNIASSLETLVAGQVRQVDTLIVDVDLLNQKVRLNRELQTAENLSRLQADVSK